MTTKNTPWLRTTTRNLVSALASNQSATTWCADELRDLAMDVAPNPPHPNLWGSLFLVLAKMKVIRRTNQMTPSLFATAHGRRVPTYKVYPRTAQRLLTKLAA